jgi:hypothetical protein
MHQLETIQPTDLINRPIELVEGQGYLLRIRQSNGHKPILRTVKFIGYTPCPGVVIVSECDGWIQRVSRVDLYAPAPEEKFSSDLIYSC